MNENRTEDVVEMVKTVLNDYENDRDIDQINIYNKPDKEEIRELVRDLFRIVFPGYFKDKSVKIYNPKNSMAVVMENVFYHLNKQVTLALDFCKRRGTLTKEEREKESYSICRRFFEKLPTVREYVETDLQAAYDGDPAAGCKEEIILAYPGLMASTVNRIAHELYLLHVPVLPRIMTEYAHSLTGIDIHPGATIEDNVTIYAGASVLGGDTVIGKNAVIGGNAFITSSIPGDARVSIKNQELEYRTGKNQGRKTEEIHQSEEWYYII